MVEKASIELVKGSSPDQFIASSPRKPPFKSRAIAHFKRRWWVHLIILAIVTLVITLPLVYVGYPRIAQDGINDSTLRITSMKFSSPKPSGFYLHQVQVLGSDSIFHQKLYSFNAAVRLPGYGKPMMNITVPSIQANDGATIEVNQSVAFEDAYIFAEFSKALLLEKEVSLNIYGKPRLKQAGLHTITVTYNHTITMKGLDKLAGFEVLELQLDPGRDDGMNAKGSVLIPNPSVMTLAMVCLPSFLLPLLLPPPLSEVCVVSKGYPTSLQCPSPATSCYAMWMHTVPSRVSWIQGNVTFDLSSSGTDLGPAVIRELVLRPGNNTAPIVANVDELALLGLFPQHPPFSIDMQALGNSSVYDGSELPYYTAALEANPITFNFDVSQALPS
ncbi:hypothetical protein BJY04DRAFT_217961 [Aspergillus karnatakaensis]|uniref:DUF3712 domain-containing protein n=1 Tax=Aspergillus karnatakaensis TaxID=1810916 RepID=UPI003CCD5BD5